MKIWQRIFIVTMFIVTVFTLAMGLLLIGNQYKYQIDAEINNSKKFHENVMASVNVEVQRQMQEKTKSILSDHEFLEAYKAAYERFEDLGYGLKLSMDGENIMNNYDFSDDIVNKNMIKQERYAGYEIVHKSDYYFLIMESENSIYGRKIKCDTEYDITHIYGAYFAQRDRLKVLTIVFSLLSGIILLVTIRFLLRPVKKLQWGIHSISDGDYGRQLEVKGNNEITELTKDVNQMSEKIADDNRAKEEMIESRQVFIDNMAHEMKTPLTAILGFSDILTIKQNLTEEQIKEYSGYIYKEALRLKTMSGKLMELAQIEEKNVKGECVDIGNILDEVILSEQIVLEKSNIKINKRDVNNMGIGSKMNKLMQEKNINANELANKIGIAPTTIYSMIKRDSKKADIEVLIRIAKELGVSVEYFSDEPTAPTTLAAHFDGDEYTEEELEEIRQFAEFVKNRNNNK